eukprot:s5926_g5.t1
MPGSSDARLFQGPKELEVEMISPLSKVSFRNFSVDLSDQPASPTHAATEFLRGALAKTPIDLEELSMALEQAKRADVDSMLLLRGEDVFMELIEKQAADLRQAIAKAEASKIGPDEFPDASGCGIVKRAKAVVEQEELAAMEELRRSLNAGARDQAPILTSSPVLGDLVYPALSSYIAETWAEVQRWAQRHFVPNVTYQDWETFIRSQWSQHTISSRTPLSFDDIKYIKSVIAGYVVQGSAIGNQISPFLANIAVSYKEQQWYDSYRNALEALRSQVYITRYVDNRLVLYQWNSRE